MTIAVDQVDAAATKLALSRDVAHALLSRGHTVDEIAVMSPADKFDEYCRWKGLIGWAGTLLRVAVEVGAAKPSGD